MPADKATAEPAATDERRYLWACDHELSLIIVEDDDNDLKIICHYLRSINPDFDLRIARTAAEGLAMQHELPADCVLLDYYLPDQNANAVLEELSAMDRSTAVVVLSGTNQFDVLAHVLALGATDYLFKAQLDVRSVREVINKSVLRATQPLR
ncbi:MAG: response regulator [Pseudomonadota bacterium]